MQEGAMQAIVNGQIVTPGEPVRPGTVVLDGGRIARLAPPDEPLPRGTAIIDAGGGYVAPGFIDVHVHGGGGADFMDATPEAVRTVCRFHASGGSTGLLATTAAAPTEALLAALQVIAGVQREGTGGAAILGVHLEGPYFAPTKHGCHLPDQVRAPRPEEYRRLLDACPGLVRWVTLAPEIDGALELIAALAERGIVASAEHSEATEAEVLAAISAGLRHATHLYCAMSTITKRGPERVPGLVETALASDELTTEVIADGHHLAPALLRIAVKAKGPRALLLVTDAMRGAGMPDGRYTFGPPDGAPAIVEGGVARTPDNTGFASSTARANQLVRNMVRLASCSLAEAVEMASLTPARALGLAERKGRLYAGYDADVVVLDEALEVRATIVAGEVVYSRTAL
jgi:N-acetylglucosamine-6-phosphate deacetylase